MYLDHLTLIDFRSYPSVELALSPGVLTFVGANGQGKTNLVEAVEYLSTLGSHRVAADQPLVRLGAAHAVVRGRVRAGLSDDRALLLEVQITPGAANRAKVNRAALPRAREILGILRTVVFSPVDLDLIRGDPADRRAFIDALVISRWPRLAGVKLDYERVLRQRNTLLKSLSTRAGRARPNSGPNSGGDDHATLQAWDEQLATFGADLLFARLTTVSELAPHTAQAYTDIAPTAVDVGVEYKSTIPIDDMPHRDELVTRFHQQIELRRRDELHRGVSLVGPHRDDVVLGLGALPAKGYASHGESWSLACALRLGSFALLRADGIEPVLILDDVFAELDSARRVRLASMVSEAEQVLVTAAVAADVPSQLAGARFSVSDQQVSPDG